MPVDRRGLVGESGAGKSMIGKAVLGVLPRAVEIVEGEILLEGDDLLKASPATRRRLIGAKTALVPQDPLTALNPSRRIGRQITDRLVDILGWDKARATTRALEMLAEVRIQEPERVMRLYPHELSGGMRQRVLIAAAFAAEPSLIVADEPTTALDVTVQKQALHLISQMQARRGTALMFITHDSASSPRYATRFPCSTPARSWRIRRSRRSSPGRATPTAPRCWQPRRATPTPALRSGRCRARCSTPWRRRSPRRTWPGGGMAEALFRIEDLFVDVPDMTRKPLFGAAPRLRILKGLSFDIPRGAVLGIVGGSGSGKTTLGRTLLRLVEPAGGRILFDGRDIAHLSDAAMRPLRGRIQMIFQDPMSSLNPRLTVGRIVAAPLRAGAGDPRVEQALEQVGLSAAFAGRYPHELSGGQRQRVGIARAIAMRPDFILADEIVSGLDVSSQAQVLNLLEGLVQKLGLTLAFISHDLSVIRRLCSRVIVMQEGLIVEDAATGVLFERPGHPYTRELLDAIPVPDPAVKW